MVAVLAALGLAAALAGSATATATDPRVEAGVWPFDPRPRVVAGFDPPALTWGAGHRGVDLEGRVGQPVRSVLAGEVSYAGVLAGRGVVVVDHGGRRTTYEPVAADVAVGDLVTTGQPLGTLAPTPGHCSPVYCLHWGLILTTPSGDEYADPLTLVGGGPVRLVPWDGLPRAGGLGSDGLGSDGLGAADAGPEQSSSNVSTTWVASGARVGLAVGLP